jgi:hypothetical protein
MTVRSEVVKLVLLVTHASLFTKEQLAILGYTGSAELGLHQTQTRIKSEDGDAGPMMNELRTPYRDMVGLHCITTHQCKMLGILLAGMAAR